MTEKLIITSEELFGSRVEAKLRERDMVSRTQQHYEQASLPTATAPHRRLTFLYNTIFYMGAFGFIGGLLGWTTGEIMHLRPNARMEARELIDAERELLDARASNHLTAAATAASIRELQRAGRDNPYFAIHSDQSLTADQRSQRWEAISKRDEMKDFLANVLFYSMSGMMIAASLSMAEQVVNRNGPGTLLYGSAGAMAGLVGGVIVSLFVDRLHDLILGPPGARSGAEWQMLSRSVSWGVLGMFLSLAPGLVLRNRKKLWIGMAGGFVGGLVGGALFDPVSIWTGSQHLSRLIAIIAVGLVAGIGAGLIENAAKTGWFKVTSGLIAGKQFVLYRNPTYIGASPQSHIYLFKDAAVGRRHAAVHVLNTGYELEDLPLGGKTYVNDKPVSRAKLHSGDRVRVGNTTFTFQERVKSAS